MQTNAPSTIVRNKNLPEGTQELANEAWKMMAPRFWKKTPQKWVWRPLPSDTSPHEVPANCGKFSWRADQGTGECERLSGREEQKQKNKRILSPPRKGGASVNLFSLGPKGRRPSSKGWTGAGWACHHWRQPSGHPNLRWGHPCGLPEAEVWEEMSSRAGVNKRRDEAVSILGSGGQMVVYATQLLDQWGSVNFM